MTRSGQLLATASRRAVSSLLNGAAAAQQQHSHLLLVKPTSCLPATSFRTPSQGKPLAPASLFLLARAVLDDYVAGDVHAIAPSGPPGSRRRGQRLPRCGLVSMCAHGPHTLFPSARGQPASLRPATVPLHGWYRMAQVPAAPCAASLRPVRPWRRRSRCRTQSSIWMATSRRGGHVRGGQAPRARLGRFGYAAAAAAVAGQRIHGMDCPGGY